MQILTDHLHSFWQVAWEGKKNLCLRFLFCSLRGDIKEIMAIRSFVQSLAPAMLMLNVCHPDSVPLTDTQCIFAY